MILESVEMENKIYKEVRNQRAENRAIQMIGRYMLTYVIEYAIYNIWMSFYAPKNKTSNITYKRQR